MKKQILGPEYLLDVEKCIWARAGYVGIQYNDGDEVEQRIAKIIDSASDITVFSPELRTHCTDWPSHYHLSSMRPNILRPFAAALCGDILEIGAGCGAITRYLGESGANILALEGSPRRAAIARSRTRDLENVIVLAEKFDQFECEHRFDLITLIGVLEYANLFTSGENPACIMLQRVRSLLKPNGKLIVAIENQLGLKYFAGAPEDHLGQAMYGIEGRYRRGEPQTFGKRELSCLLEISGFKHNEFFSPFPDYKLPTSIITPSGLRAGSGFDPSTLAVINVTQDRQLPVTTNFSLELAWPVIMKNFLGGDLANSFLVIATLHSSSSVEPSVLAYHYSTQRRKEFCKENRFERTAGGEVVVKMFPLFKNGKLSVKDEALKLEWSLLKEKPYRSGHLLAQEFIGIVTRPGWRIREVESFFQRYLNFLPQLSANGDLQCRFKAGHDLLPGYYLDALPVNIIITPDDTATLIDNEWFATEGVELGYLLFRAFTSLIDLVSRFAPSACHEATTRGELIEGGLSLLGFHPSSADFSRFLQLESQLSAFSTGMVNRTFTTWSPELPLPGLGFTERCIEYTQQRLAQTEQAKDYAERLAIKRLTDLDRIKASIFWRIGEKLGLTPSVGKTNE
jgi:SAM-dependent methyltransferase